MSVDIDLIRLVVHVETDALVRILRRVNQATAPGVCTRKIWVIDRDLMGGEQTKEVQVSRAYSIHYHR